MFLVIILSKNAHIWKCLSEQKVTWYGFMNFHEVWVKNDGTTLFQNPVRFFASPDIWYLISSQDIDNTKAYIILPSGY